jgi:hypothetical protein
MAHPDVDELLNHCFEFAQITLKKRGGFHPFAASVGSDGKMNSLGLHSDTEHPESKEMVNQYTVLLQSLASNGEARAVALCYDSRFSQGEKPKKDAIAVSIEHANGESVMAYLPYKKKLFGGFEFEPPVFSIGDRKFFR